MLQRQIVPHVVYDISTQNAYIHHNDSNQVYPIQPISIYPSNVYPNEFAQQPSHIPPPPSYNEVNKIQKAKF